MHGSNSINPLTIQVLMFIVLFVRSTADTNPKKKTSCSNTWDLFRYETSHEHVKAKCDKSFLNVGVPCPPPGYLHIVCNISTGQMLPCDTRAYIMDFCYRNNPKFYRIDERFYECEKHCPDSVCMEILLFKKWGLSNKFIKNGGLSSIRKLEDCFFEEPLYTVIESTTEKRLETKPIGTRDKVVPEPLHIAITVICITLPSLIIIALPVLVIYLRRRAHNRMHTGTFGKRIRKETTELNKKKSNEEPIDLSIRLVSQSPRIQDRRSFPVYDKLIYIDSDQNEDL